jgi:hypothetical protein
VFLVETVLAIRSGSFQMQGVPLARFRIPDAPLLEVTLDAMVVGATLGAPTAMQPMLLINFQTLELRGLGATSGETVEAVLLGSFQTLRVLLVRTTQGAASEAVLLVCFPIRDALLVGVYLAQAVALMLLGSFQALHVLLA